MLLFNRAALWPIATVPSMSAQAGGLWRPMPAGARPECTRCVVTMRGHGQSAHPSTAVVSSPSAESRSNLRGNHPLAFASVLLH
jgi:hypothetical protein